MIVIVGLVILVAAVVAGVAGMLANGGHEAPGITSERKRQQDECRRQGQEHRRAG
jgi:hypothetical protein